MDMKSNTLDTGRWWLSRPQRLMKATDRQTNKQIHVTIAESPRFCGGSFIILRHTCTRFYNYYFIYLFIYFNALGVKIIFIVLVMLILIEFGPCQYLDL